MKHYVCKHFTACWRHFLLFFMIKRLFMKGLNIRLINFPKEEPRILVVNIEQILEIVKDVSHLITIVQFYFDADMKLFDHQPKRNIIHPGTHHHLFLPLRNNSINLILNLFLWLPQNGQPYSNSHSSYYRPDTTSPYWTASDRAHYRTRVSPAR
jgi:hypothetical protein